MHSKIQRLRYWYDKQKKSKILLSKDRGFIDGLILFVFVLDSLQQLFHQDFVQKAIQVFPPPSFDIFIHVKLTPVAIPRFKIPISSSALPSLAAIKLFCTIIA